PFGAHVFPFGNRGPRHYFRADKRRFKYQQHQPATEALTNPPVLRKTHMHLEYIFPVLTLVLGWFLNSVTPVLTKRREHQAALNKAIADLLEIHHALKSMQVAFGELKKILKVSGADERLIRTMVLANFPLPQNLSARYDDIVTLIAASDPLLGF